VLDHDPRKRIPISRFVVDDQDRVRRRYIRVRRRYIELGPYLVYGT
jgi:hypothetical protein